MPGGGLNVLLLLVPVFVVSCSSFAGSVIGNFVIVNFYFECKKRLKDSWEYMSLV